MTRWGLVVAVLVLAGCLAQPIRPSPPPAASTPRFGEPVLVGRGGAYESSLRIAGNEILACAHGAFAKPSPTWASRDDGAAWVNENTHPGTETGDCDVVIDPDGTWYGLYDTNDSPSGTLGTADADPGRTTLAVSSDKGASWHTTIVPVTNTPQSDRPWMAMAGTTLVVVGGNYMLKYPGITSAATTTDHGASFRESVVALAQPPQYPNMVRGPLVVSADGRTVRAPIVLTNIAQDDAPEKLEFGVSRDQGSSWTVEGVAENIHGFNAGAAAETPDGTLYWAYSTGKGIPNIAVAAASGLPNMTADIVVISSVDDGRTWSTPLVVAHAQNFSAPNVWIDARHDGSATLTWEGHDGDGKAILSAARVHAKPHPTVEWSEVVITPVDVNNPTDWGPSVRHDAQSKAVIAYPMKLPDCRDGPGGSQCVFIVREL